MVTPWTVAVLCLGLTNTLATADGGVRWVSQALAEAMVGYAPSSQTNHKCNTHSFLYLEGLSKSILWAVQMLDSSSGSVGGLLSGDMYSLGHYDQCLEVLQPIRAQYCLATLEYGPTLDAQPSYYSPPNKTYVWPPNTSPVWDKIKMTLDPGVIRRDVFYWSLCVPASCSAQDIETSLNSRIYDVFSKYNLKGKVLLDKASCEETRIEIPITQGYIITKFFIWLIVAVTIIATVYDYMVASQREEKPKSGIIGILERILIAFSLRINMLILTDKSTNPRLEALNGGKVISIGAIIFGHRTMHLFGLVLYNHEYWERKYSSFGDIALMNGSHLVDLFFYSSGLLSFLGIYKDLEKRKSLNFLSALIYRWTRIVPPYLLMMGIVGWMLPHMSDGPLWNKRVGLESERCQQNWWLNLLFINNYVHEDKECLLLSWYLACDMQLFVLGMFVIYVVWRWPKVGYVLLAVLLAASIAIPSYITYRHKYYGTIRVYIDTLLKDPFSNEHFRAIYIKGHTRAGPYIVGLITALACIKLDAANYKFSKTTMTLGLIVFLGGGYAVQSYCYFFYLRDYPYNAFENAFYAGVHRIAYSVGIAWCGIVCYTTEFEPIKVILGQPVFTPLARLVYCIVLTHPVIDLASVSTARHSEYLTYAKLFSMACGDYVVCLLLSLPLYLMVEAPSRSIIKMIFDGFSHPPSLKDPETKLDQTPNQVSISRL